MTQLKTVERTESNKMLFDKYIQPFYAIKIGDKRDNVEKILGYVGDDFKNPDGSIETYYRKDEKNIVIEYSENNTVKSKTSDFPYGDIIDLINAKIPSSIAEKIKVGMTYSEVEKIVGIPGLISKEYIEPAVNGRYFTIIWRGTDNNNLTVMFDSSNLVYTWLFNGEDYHKD